FLPSPPGRAPASGPDKAAADHGEPLPLASQFSQMGVVIQGAEVDDWLAAEGQATGRAAGSQEQLAVAVGGPLVIGNPLVLRVQVPSRPPQVKGHPLAFGLAPDALQRFAFPELFGQGRAGIRRGALRTELAAGGAAVGPP